MAKLINRGASCWSNTQTSSNYSLCGQPAPRAFYGVMRSARSLRRAWKPEADSASSTVLLPAGIDRVGRLSNFTFFTFTFTSFFFSHFFARISVFTNFKILLINCSFNFTAFICVVGQKKRSCVAASLWVVHESMTLHSNLICCVLGISWQLAWSEIL